MEMAMKQAPRNDWNITPEAFITAWQTSDTVEEVCEKTGMPKPIVLARASAYRRSGINMKHMRRKDRRGLDVEKLNRLIEGLEAKRPPEAAVPDEV
jgi:hypothetical protein